MNTNLSWSKKKQKKHVHYYFTFYFWVWDENQIFFYTFIYVNWWLLYVTQVYKVTDNINLQKKKKKKSQRKLQDFKTWQDAIIWR